MQLSALSLNKLYHSEKVSSFKQLNSVLNHFKVSFSHLVELRKEKLSCPYQDCVRLHICL